MRSDLIRIEPTKAYIYALVLASVFSLACWIYLFDSSGIYFSWISLFGSLALAALCALSRRFPIEFRLGTIEVGDIAVLVALTFFGPLYALGVAIPSVIYRDRLRTVFVASSEILLVSVCGLIFMTLSTPLVTTLDFNATLVYSVTAMGFAYYLLDGGITSILMRIKHGVSFLDNAKDYLFPKLPSDLLAILSTLGTAFVMVGFGPAAALVLFLGAAGAVISLHLIHTRKSENESLKSENAALLSANVRFAASLVEALGKKAPYVGRISSATSIYAGDIGAEFGFERERLDLIKISALLQDIGLNTVPDAVLLADPNRLNPEGKRELERHPIVGEEILSSVPGFEEAAQWVRWHHELTDGSGYPDAMQGRWLPLEARILAVAGTYASYALDSPGSPSLTGEEARFRLISESDSTLDSEVVRAFLRLLDREGADYAAASDERFSFGKQAEETIARTPSLRVVGDDQSV